MRRKPVELTAPAPLLAVLEAAPGGGGMPARAQAAGGGRAPRVPCPLLDLEYYDGTLPSDAEPGSGTGLARCRLDVHLPATVPGSGAGCGAAVLFIHGGTWRAGHRARSMYAGAVAELAGQFECCIVPVGYRRTRMPAAFFFGLYPGVVAAALALVTAPGVLAAVLLGWLPPALAPAPALGLALVYYVFWGCYPAGGGNFSSQCTPPPSSLSSDCVRGCRLIVWPARAQVRGWRGGAGGEASG